MLQQYYLLTKPGIIRGNLVTALAGLLLAAQGDIDFVLLLATLAGVAFVIAAGCVFNNYIDRDIDERMKRTKKRPLVTGSISGPAALAYGTVLAAIGFTSLAVWTNALTVWIGVTGIVFYVVVYGIAKRASPIGTVVGSISGAIPPVAGYTAVRNDIDAGAIILFFLLACWQMPHFYAIAMYRSKEYAAAKIPVLPLVKGMLRTKQYIMLYIPAFISACIALTIYGYTGYIFLAVAVGLGLFWYWKGIQGFRTDDNVKWARGMFGYSLLALMGVSAMICIDSLLNLR